MDYIVFARKWRPQKFEEIVGQEHITTTLKNAIDLNRIAHAYIFSGPRGVGKTSTARIFAKALNCVNGPTSTPCNNCVVCNEITSGSSMDVLEIDGASNRGIDEIRNLRENVKFIPSGGKFKVYIIDEVHMLTQEAFNALLKTLEEPPSHVKFIFATTRPEKVLSTILSRCQRFDFKRISETVIVEKLKYIAKNEKIQIQQDALFTIARASEGSLRDAESILDQLVSLYQRKINTEDVTELLGVVSYDVISDFVNNIYNKKIAESIVLVNKLVNDGKDIYRFVNELCEYYRDILLVKAGAEDEKNVLLSKAYRKTLKEQSEKYTVEQIFYIINILLDASSKMKYSSIPKVPLELAIVKISNLDKIFQFDDILEKLNELKKKLTNKIQCKDSVKNNFSLKTDIEKNIIKDTTKDSVYEGYESEIKTQTKDIVKETITSSKNLCFEDIKNSWDDIVNKIKKKKMSLGVYLSEAQLINFKNNKLFLGFHPQLNFHKKTLEKNKKIIEKVINSIFNENILMEFKSFLPDSEDKQMQKEMSILDNEIIKSAVDIFNGKIIFNGQTDKNN